MSPDDQIFLVLYKDPDTGSPYVGDQFGRRLEGVTSFSVSDDAINGRRFQLSVEDVANLYVRSQNAPLTLRGHTPQRGDHGIRVKTAEGFTATSIPVDSKKRLVKVTIPGDPAREEVEGIQRQMESMFGDDTICMVFTRPVELEVFSLDTADDADIQKEVTERKKKADWGF